MLNDRMKNLLNEAGHALQDGRDPFEHSFLAEHNVTLDEVYSLGEMIDLAITCLIGVESGTAQLFGTVIGSGVFARTRLKKTIDEGVR